MPVFGPKLFAEHVERCVVVTDSPFPGDPKGTIVGVDLGVGVNGQWYVGELFKGGVLRIMQGGHFSENGLAGVYAALVEENQLEVAAWVMGWDGEVRQSLTGTSAAEWLRARGQRVITVREGVDYSLSRLGRCMDESPHELKIQIESGCTKLIAALRTYQAAPPDGVMPQDDNAWTRHCVDALRYMVTPDWRPLVGRHAIVAAAV